MLFLCAQDAQYVAYTPGAVKKRDGPLSNHLKKIFGKLAVANIALIAWCYCTSWRIVGRQSQVSMILKPLGANVNATVARKTVMCNQIHKVVLRVDDRIHKVVLRVDDVLPLEIL